MKRFLFIILVFSGTVVLAQSTNLTSMNVESYNEAPTTTVSQPHFKVSQGADSVFNEKSVGKAFFMSLIMPGSGEYYVGKKKHTAYLVTSEVLLWLGMFANEAYTDFLVNEYKTYAVQHADVKRTGKDKQYWADIGKYDDIYSFNEQRQRERDFEALYDDIPDNYWAWDTRTKRISYDADRLRANEFAARIIYYQSAIVLNHLVSAINAMYQAKVYNKRGQPTSTAWDIRFKASPATVVNSYFGTQLSIRF